MTNSEIKNKHLDVDGDGSDSGSSSGSKANSGRSSPYIREAHQKKHHHDSHKHDGNRDGDSGEQDQDHGRESPQERQQRNKHIGRKIQHGLQKSSSRNTGIPLDCYIGLAFRVMKTEEEIEEYRSQVGGMSTSVVDLEKGEQLLTWQAVVSDGIGTIDSGRDATTLKVTSPEEDEKQGWKMVKHVAERIITTATEVSAGKSMIFQVIAVSEPLPPLLAKCPIFLPSFYAHLSAIPFLIPSPTYMFENLPDPDPEYFASNAVSVALKHLHPAIHSAVTVGCREEDRVVQVDAGGLIHIASLEGYQQSSSEKLWKRFMALVRHIKGNNIKFARVSATPQGGGVALLQNALVRLWKLVGLEENGIWLVPLGHPSVFDITKKKFHNVLQGVAEKDVKLEENDEAYFEAWIKSNYEKFWKDTGVLTDRILVADDPQVVPLIPRVKKDFPDTKIIFRSHIQIQSDLTDDDSTEQAHVWDYLFGFIKHSDMFLAHPVDFFIPKNVKKSLPVMYMPPSTDPLDGLNKPFGKESMEQIQKVYNSLSMQQSGVELDWNRGYFLQVARFDPSKGLNDLLAGYLQFRQKVEEAGKGGDDGDVKRPPQLIVVGHGSIDDPDGTRIYEELHEIVNSDEYKLVTKDVSIVRAPPSDTLLGGLMQGATVALQLSTREGFEVKVSEAVLKRIPVVATKAGGIPLQVKDGVNGWIVDPSAPDQVAQVLFDFYMGKRQLNRRQGRPDEEYCDDRMHHHKTYDEEEVVQELPRSDGKENPNHTDADHIGDPGIVGFGDGDSKIKEGRRLTPNDSADMFVKTVGAPFPKVKPTPDGPSEDFFTVGNAAKWLLLFSLISGKSIKPDAHSKANGGQGDGEVELLKSMGLRTEDWKGGKEEMKKWDNQAVWKMVMGDDTDEGEGRIIWRDEMFQG